MPQAYFSMLLSSVHISSPTLMIHLKTLAAKNREVLFSVKMNQHGTSPPPEERGTGSILLSSHCHRDFAQKGDD